MPQKRSQYITFLFIVLYLHFCKNREWSMTMHFRWPVTVQHCHWLSSDAKKKTCLFFCKKKNENFLLNFFFLQTDFISWTSIFTYLLYATSCTRALRARSQLVRAASPLTYMYRGLRPRYIIKQMGRYAAHLFIPLIKFDNINSFPKILISLSIRGIKIFLRV